MDEGSRDGVEVRKGKKTQREEEAYCTVCLLHCRRTR